MFGFGREIQKPTNTETRDTKKWDKSPGEVDTVHHEHV